MNRQTIQDRTRALADADPSNVWRLLGLMMASAPDVAARNIALLEGWQAREEERVAAA